MGEDWSILCIFSESQLNTNNKSIEKWATELILLKRICTNDQQIYYRMLSSSSITKLHIKTQSYFTIVRLAIIKNKDIILNATECIKSMLSATDPFN